MQLYTKILLGMLVGVALGLVLGPNSSLMPHDGVTLSAGAAIRSAPSREASPAPFSKVVRSAQVVQEQQGWLQLRWKLRSSDVLRLQSAGDAPRGEGAAGLRPQKGVAYEGWVHRESSHVSSYSMLGQTLIDATYWLGDLFLALIKMVVVPLVFFSLTVGVASLGDFRRLGRMGGRTLAVFMATTVAALLIGVSLANLLQPGGLLSADDRARLLAAYEGDAGQKLDAAADAPSFVDQVVGIVPANPIASLATGEMLQIIFFAVMFGIALTLMDEKRSKPVVSILDAANEAMVTLVHIAMKLAPIGVAALLFKVVGTTGLSVLGALGYYALLVVLGLLIHLVVTYGSIIRFGARLPFFGFLRAIRPALLLAFSTSSSSATLPVTKECAEENLGVSGPVSSFVIPLGATINMDGTALYQGVAALFIAQIYGMDLGVADQVTIITSATLASVGAAGVPGAGMITLAMVLTSVGVPTEGLALVLGVDRLLDMFRTSVNVVGDSAVTALMARLEGDELQVSAPKRAVASPTTAEA